MKHPRTPRLARLLLWLAVGYLVLPIDLIPDCLPGIGHLDDLILVPALILLALKLVPPDVVAQCRARAKEQEHAARRPRTGETL